ncbi:MAG: DUF2064 domain-containing protein [Bdellovibrionaceae bacterium]|nr:DUF2064 domain-containing protein [Bdellovibrionales bacterium]MCB9084080.1 DUF2064 domain-containing protein [Pseudobdellovibrionaceae bacterium]
MAACGLAVFVKTPGFSPLKTRLARTLGSARAVEFHLRSAFAMEALLHRLTRLETDLNVFWAVAEADALEDPLWRGFPRLGQGEGSLGARLSHVFDQLWQEHEQVIFVGNDSPQVSLEVWQELLQESQNYSYYLGLTEDGGFYFLSARKNIPPSVWNKISYSQSTTARALMGELKVLGSVGSGFMSYDVDEGSDLARLARENRVGGLLPEQIDLINWAQEMSEFLAQPGGQPSCLPPNK